MRVDLKYRGIAAALVDEDEDDFIIRSINRSKSFYEKELLDEIYHLAMPDWFFVDVGAHIGNHSVFFGKVLGLDGLAVEPNPISFKKLQNNIEINGLERQITTLNAGASRKKGKAILAGNQIANNSGTNTIVPDENGEVDLITLDSLSLIRADFLKLDIEGDELSCLKGARNILLKFKPILCVELMDRQAFINSRDWLASLGYRPARRFNHTPTYLFTV